MDIRSILIGCNCLGQVALVTSGALVMSGWHISGVLLAIVGVVFSNGALLMAARCKMVPVEPESEEQ